MAMLNYRKDAYIWCFHSLFKGCDSLLTAPRLPATTLGWSCYDEMFKGCTRLQKAPYLPAKTLYTSCYKLMFNGCSSLNEIRVAFKDWQGGDDPNTYQWLNGVASTGKFYKDEALLRMTNDDDGEICRCIPTNWEIIDWKR